MGSVYDQFGWLGMNSFGVRDWCNCHFVTRSCPHDVQGCQCIIYGHLQIPVQSRSAVEILRSLSSQGHTCMVMWHFHRYLIQRHFICIGWEDLVKLKFDATYLQIKLRVYLVSKY